MTHRTLILVIRRLSERARKAERNAIAVAGWTKRNIYNDKVDCDRYIAAINRCAAWERQARLCRAKIDQLTERYSEEPQS